MGDIMSNGGKKVVYEWVNVMKFMGMFAIYLGHLGKSAGKLYPFVFQYHVPLFFLLSGFFAVSSLKVSFLENLKKKIKTILVPYVIFCILNISMFMINQNSEINSLLSMIKQSAFGIRNQMFAPALWFLPCLFVTAVTFDMILRLFNKCTKYYIYIVFGISVVLYVISITILPNNPIGKPSWWFNIDSAMYYMIYYAIGALVFPFIKDKSYKSLKFADKFTFNIITFAALIVTGFIYLKGPGYLINKLPFSLPRYISVFVGIIRALVIIYLNLILARSLTGIRLFSKMGQETLVFCGTETIIKTTVSNILTMLGLSLKIATPYIACIYTMLVLVLSHFTLVPFINKYLNKISQKFNRIRVPNYHKVREINSLNIP